MDIAVLVYWTWGLGLNNHIIRKVIGSIFHHIPRRRWRDEHQSQYKEIKSNLIKSSQKNKTNKIKAKDWNKLGQATQ